MGILKIKFNNTDGPARVKRTEGRAHRPQICWTPLWRRLLGRPSRQSAQIP